MAKYSTGRSGGNDDGDACELCGRESGNLRRATVAGAELLVCPSCAPHDDRQQSRSEERSSDDSEPDRSKRAAQRAAELYDAAQGDSTHWEEEGTDYEEDRLPYLVSNYGDRVERARQGAGLRPEELAEAIDVDEETVLAVEQGRAARAGVGGSVIRRIEAELDVEIVDE